MKRLRVLGPILVAMMIITVLTPGRAVARDRCGQDTPGPPKNNCTASLLYFNDAHDVRPVVTDGVSRGGVARLATVLRTDRQTEPYSATVFGGDLAGGTLFGGVYHGHPMVEAFDTIGIDVANFGQHDFDFGVANTRALMAKSDFDWVSSNLVDADGAPFSGLPWTVRQVGAFRVGFLGLTDAMDTTGADTGVDQRPVIEAARQALARMTAEQRPDVVVAVTQQGPEENAALIDQVPGVDLVLTEEVAEDRSVLTRHRGTWIAAPEGNIGSTIKIDIRRHGHRTMIIPSVLEVDGSVRPDPELQRLEDHYAADLEQRLGKRISTVRTALPLTDNAHRQGEVALGDLVADAFRSGAGFADGKPADVGWIQGGGLRAAVPAGDFTLASGYGVLPFGNKLIKVEATGEQLRSAVEQGLAGYQDLGGGFPQISGISYTFDPDRPVGARVTAITVGGKPLDLAASYTVAMTDYVYRGGDDVTAFADSTLLVDPATATIDADALNAFVGSLDVVDYRTDGRIIRS
ncbi:bifunctional metallophosphatase/5'-nucleotidase [Microlunatus soli]|uniref:5'-nucleotidase n=1 Tax=Microlunatus soli TaxID=630515 RepID=A0A1H2AHA2_9ACTN|nr:5'-nucleotidase C-terminal domain-containing protein [Microlunatus soli]SDT45351.1 5'-nucleotidase [Microlunatus soli]